MKISKITIHNFLRLKDVEINPTHTNVIVGKNKQGKTSILKAIQTAFEGKADATSIRIGEDKAEINIEIGDLNIKRSITEKGNHLAVTNKEGMSYPAPQKFLDGLLGTFSFNPIEFFEKKAADRKKYLLDAVKMTITQDELAVYTGEKLAGLDYEGKHALEVVEDARKWYYDKRTVANAEKTKKEKALDDLNGSIPADFDAKAVSDEEIQKLRDAIAQEDIEKVKRDARDEKVKGLQKRELELKAELEQVQKDIVEELAKTFVVSDDMALQAAKDTLKALEGKREILFTVKRRDEVRVEFDAAVQEADKLDDIVKRLAKQVPEDLIKKAAFPIPGLTIVGDDILVGGVSIDNLSHSEQIKFGLDIVRALNTEFKVVCIDGIEAMDAESFAAFLTEIENDDYQYFVTRVDGNTANSIVVEGGAVKTNN